MTTFDAALIKEQGITFVVVSVRDGLIDDETEAKEFISKMMMRFGCPAVLIGSRRHRLFGRPDLVRFLSRVHVSRLPWKRWELAA